MSQIMDEELIADMELNERKRKREAKRLIRRQAKKRKLMSEDIVCWPHRSYSSSMWTCRSIPSLKESVWRNPDVKSTNVPLYVKNDDPLDDTKQINKAFFDMKSVLEGYSMLTGALSAVFNCPAHDSPPTEYCRKPKPPRAFPNDTVIATVLIEKLAADYLNMMMLNISKQNGTIPERLKVKFQLTLDGVIDKYLRLNPKAPVNFVNAGFWKTRYIINCKDVPCRVSLREIIDKVNFWDGLYDVSEKEILELVMVSVWIPGPDEEEGIIFKRLKLQNPDLNTELWRLYHSEYSKTEEGQGQWMVLGVDENSRKMLVLSACKAKCGFEEICFVVPPFEADPNESDIDSDYPMDENTSDDDD